MKILQMVNLVDWPVQPVDLPADTTYALINEGTFPLELHGSMGEGEAKYRLVVGQVSARRGTGGLTVFSFDYKSAQHEQLVGEIAAYHTMLFGVMGGSRPYKAVLGVTNWEEIDKDIGLKALRPFQPGLVNTDEEKATFANLKVFTKLFDKVTKGVFPVTYLTTGIDGVNTEFSTIFTLKTRTLRDLDKLHLKLIQCEVEVRHEVERLGKFTWQRSNKERTLHVTLRGAQRYGDEVIELLSKLPGVR